MSKRMMKRWVHMLAASIAIGGAAIAYAGDFDADMRAAATKLETVTPESAKLLMDGDFAGANAKVMAIFPEATRTPAQSLVLGNLLYGLDPDLSYKLHKASALAEPNNSKVIWEWALEQHRAGQYAGALESYKSFSKSDPGAAIPYAMEADCLLRLNRLNEATAAWRQSEDAPNGSIESMEDMVCAVHGQVPPYARRAELLKKATAQRDVNAAASLIALDCAFPADWWNSPPNLPFLEHDLPLVLAALRLPADDVTVRAMSCAVACAKASDNDSAVAKALAKHRLFTDQDHTIPIQGDLCVYVLNAGIAARAIDDTSRHGVIGERILELARKTNDPGLWQAAAITDASKDGTQRLAFVREGWKATGDARFAADVLMLKLRQNQLTGSDPDLLAALKQFPESGLIQRAAYEVAQREHTVSEQLLADSARAEFTRFTSFVAPFTVVDRPRSDYLRAYFAQLLLLPPAKHVGV